MATNTNLELDEWKKKNFMERLSFVKYWAEYIKNIDDKKWGAAQKLLIDSQFQMSRRFYNKFAETKEGRDKIKELKKSIANK